MSKKERSKAINKAMRTTWESLESHLAYTFKWKLGKKETRAFHRKCVKEYSTVIKQLSKLY